MHKQLEEKMQQGKETNMEGGDIERNRANVRRITYNS